MLRRLIPNIAPPALRARCLAAFDLDPTKKDSLTFGARSHLRLRVTYDDGMSTSSSSLASPHEDASDVQGMMEAAQLEAFDEDLINEVGLLAARYGLLLTLCVQIRMEALRDGLKAVDPRSVKVEIPGGDLSFELVSVLRHSDRRLFTFTSTTPAIRLPPPKHLLSAI